MEGNNICFIHEEMVSDAMKKIKECSIQGDDDKHQPLKNDSVIVVYSDYRAKSEVYKSAQRKSKESKKATSKYLTKKLRSVGGLQFENSRFVCGFSLEFVVVTQQFKSELFKKPYIKIRH